MTIKPKIGQRGFAASPAIKHQRCAIYTRVSTEHGLDQEFNSLDAQREACAAYIRSQLHEGWIGLPDVYDDGGYSGGSMDRPDLARLLTDIRGGKIDIVVVYKVDRLTRSLADFAKLVEIFDQHQVSFVSVTQAFNTTSSMGRLTLNVLLSFAQFEREVTGERIRDKIAASKRKGLRMGGPTPLGYDVIAKKLVINEAEAETVRRIFRRYLDLGSLSLLMEDLNADGIKTRPVTLPSGRIRGGGDFGKGGLAHLLRNRAYVGDIVHKDQHYPGEHQPLIDLNLFDAVQSQLTEQAAQTGRLRGMKEDLRRSFLLTGKLFDAQGNRMSPTTTAKDGALYRYYVSTPLVRGRKGRPGGLLRLSAAEIEAGVGAHLARCFEARPWPITEREGWPDGTVDANESDRTEDPDTASLLAAVDRIIVRPGRLEIQWNPADMIPTAADRMVAWVPTPKTCRREIITAPGEAPTARPIRPETRARLLEGIAKAKSWLDQLVSGSVLGTEGIAAREGLSERSIRMTLNLAFLSPEIVRAVIAGQLPDGFGVSHLMDAPMDWDQQLPAAHLSVIRTHAKTPVSRPAPD